MPAGAITKVVLSALLVAIPVHAERALWTFDEDPGLVERDDGSVPSFAWSLDDGTLSVAMTREAATQRLSVPLSTSYGAPGDTDVFRLRRVADDGLGAEQLGHA